MTIREWVHKREIEGSQTFSYDDVTKAFPTFDAQHIKNDLYRLRKGGKLTQPYKGFYVVIPPHYEAKGIIPPTYYVDQLMSYLKRPYYVCLLSAAELLGAAHQRPQRFSIMTLPPVVNIQRQTALDWIYRPKIVKSLLREQNSETGIIHYSGPELTALDLVQYEQYIGGLSRAATVIEELSELTDWSGASGNGLLDQATTAAAQRLGYILENVLMNKSQADVLYKELKINSPKLNRFPLSTRKDISSATLDRRWNILVNTEIETDET